MGKKKKKGGGYRIAATVAVIAVMASLAGCTPLQALFQQEPMPADPSAPAGAATSTQAPAVVAGTALEVATWVLAALGLGPLSRVLMAAKPGIVKLVELLFGKLKTEPAKPS